MLHDHISQLVETIDGLCAADPASLADGETVVALHAQLHRLQAVVTRATDAFAVARTWEADGARSAAAWVSTRCRTPLAAARQRVRLGRDIRSMPAFEGAWLAGEVGEAHVDALAAERRRVGAERFDPDETVLVGYAKDLSYGKFRRALAYWSQAVDPDGAEERAAEQREDRRVHLSQSFEGVWFLDGLLDPIGDEVVAEALRRIEDELFSADWAEAKQRQGERARPCDLARTPAQRRADALVEMARRAGAVEAGARMGEPLLTVLVGYETFAGRVCELASGTVLTPGSLLPWLNEAWVERVVFEGPDRIKNVGQR
ncbi:MAG: 13E12 repeat family protein, partial [Actinomycetota bacterium]|nr:13E12 repeat family protein [Actinomycetota bacterium]